MTADEARFRAAIVTNPVITALIERLPTLGLPDCWLTASALTQTVWNSLSSRPPGEGISDYDVFYFDPDVSWEAEDNVIKRAARMFSDLDATIEVRNQARVHLWFDKRNGTNGYPKLASAREGIDLFLETPTMLGIHPTGGGDFDVYAPRGFDDLFGLVFRPNPNAVGPAARYAAKSEERKAAYPNLTVVPWGTT
ncbi:nucleotidyltransferase family protein [Bauldia sp.]|uniref:nucleotidyltransferase family protein n=1 Tax=Bauldia sp. TaxID=2575872 RepID=UPI003BA8FB45